MSAVLQKHCLQQQFIQNRVHLKMDNSVFLGVRMADVPYNRVCFQDISLDCNLTQSGLIQKALERFNLQLSEIGR